MYGIWQEEILFKFDPSESPIAAVPTSKIVLNNMVEDTP